MSHIRVDADMVFLPNGLVVQVFDPANYERSNRRTKQTARQIAKLLTMESEARERAEQQRDHMIAEAHPE